MAKVRAHGAHAPLHIAARDATDHGPIRDPPPANRSRANPAPRPSRYDLGRSFRYTANSRNCPSLFSISSRLALPPLATSKATRAWAIDKAGTTDGNSEGVALPATISAAACAAMGDTALSVTLTMRRPRARAKLTADTASRA